MSLADGAVIGVTGAASTALIEYLVGRAPGLNGTPVGRVLSRLLIAGTAAIVADKLGAPASVSAGIFAGPVLVTTLDATISMVGRKRLDPPPATDVMKLGDPWAPSHILP